MATQTQFIESANGFFGLKNKWVAKCTGVKLSVSVAVQDTSSFENNFVVQNEPTWISFDGSATVIGSLVTTGHTAYSGTSFTLTGTTNGAELFEAVKARLPVTFGFKNATNNIQEAVVLLTKCDMTADAGKPVQYSISFVNYSGSPTKHTS